jgi:hypothetical protein
LNGNTYGNDNQTRRIHHETFSIFGFVDDNTSKCVRHPRAGTTNLNAFANKYSATNLYTTAYEYAYTSSNCDTDGCNRRQFHKLPARY